LVIQLQSTNVLLKSALGTQILPVKPHNQILKVYDSALCNR